MKKEIYGMDVLEETVHSPAFKFNSSLEEVKARNSCRPVAVVGRSESRDDRENSGGAESVITQKMLCTKYDRQTREEDGSLLFRDDDKEDSSSSYAEDERLSETNCSPTVLFSLYKAIRKSRMSSEDLEVDEIHKHLKNCGPEATFRLLECRDDRDILVERLYKYHPEDVIELLEAAITRVDDICIESSAVPI